MTDDRKQRLQGTYAGLHKGFLATNHPADYARLEQTGELDAYLRTLGEQAADYYQTLTEQMQSQAEEIVNPREKRAYLAQVPFRASEIVRTDIVFVKL